MPRWLAKAVSRPLPRVPVIASSTAGRSTAGPPVSSRGVLLHLIALWAFAVAQPLFQVLGRYPTFFVAHGSPPPVIVAFTATVIAVPPLLMALLVSGTARLCPPAGYGLHVALVGSLVAIAILPPLHAAVELPPFVACGVALAGGALAAWTYQRHAAARSFASALAPGALVFPLLFLFHSPLTPLLGHRSPSAAAAVAVGRPAPVVFVVFDELALPALMDGHGGIDALRYPSFAALAQTATWYRRASSVADATPVAVPAILTGALPDHGRMPVSSDHPRNLFTLLGGTYELHVSERVTALCPAALCPQSDSRAARAAATLVALLADGGAIFLHRIAPPELRRALPSIQERWTLQLANWNRLQMVNAKVLDPPARFARFLGNLERRTQPALFFLHVLLPHAPYRYLPSGTRYDPPPWYFGRPAEDARRSPARLDAPRWRADNREGARVRHLRYLNQLAYVDQLLGQLLQRLRDTGMFDETLLVVTADHGICLRPGHSHRYADGGNLADLMSVPLFIKAPYQAAGRIDDRDAQTIDILPTLAEMLDVAVPWVPDGRSLVASADALPPRDKVLYTAASAANQLELRAIPVPRAMLDRPIALEHQLALFSAGTPLEDNGPTAPLRVLLGQPVDEMLRAPSADASAVLFLPHHFEDVQPESGFIPAFVRGQVEGNPPLPAGTPVAVAVNGVIAAITELLPNDAAAPAFGALVPETVWQRGANRVQVFAVVEDDDGFALAPLSMEQS